MPFLSMPHLLHNTFCHYVSVIRPFSALLSCQAFMEIISPRVDNIQRWMVYSWYWLSFFPFTHSSMGDVKWHLRELLSMTIYICLMIPTSILQVLHLWRIGQKGFLTDFEKWFISWITGQNANFCYFLTHRCLVTFLFLMLFHGL